MFYFLQDFHITNCVDDSTPYCAGKSTEFVVNNLERSSTILFEWLNNNYMKVNTICYFQVILERKKASQKLNALPRITPYMNIQKRRTIIKSFVISQFTYFPLIWMFLSRRLNNNIDSIHERALRITYQDNTSTFHKLLNKYKSVSVHHRNLQVLATEMFEIH